MAHGIKEGHALVIGEVGNDISALVAAKVPIGPSFVAQPALAWSIDVAARRPFLSHGADQSRALPADLDAMPLQHGWKIHAAAKLGQVGGVDPAAVLRGGHYCHIPMSDTASYRALARAGVSPFRGLPVRTMGICPEEI